MNSGRLVVFATLLLGAAPLAAQSPVEENFKLEGLYANDPTLTVNAGSGNFTAYSSPYIGGLAPLATPNSYATLTVWCVDELHESFIGQSYEAWITPLGGDDLSHTRLVDQTGYDWAAYLAGSMDLDWSSSANQAQSVALQDAIWALLGEGANAATRLSTFEGSTLAASLGITPGMDFDTAPLPSGFDPSDWALITCDPGVGEPVSSCGSQEFLAQISFPQEEHVTPEPGTLPLLASGMAGVFGMRLRRRKRRRA